MRLLPWLSALDNAALARRVAGDSKSVSRARAHEHFAAFGLEGFERARPAELSGGMRQRVAFLRALLAGRPVLCLDEPFAALDALTRGQAQGWLGEALAREPRTVLLVTHDVEEAVLLADRIALMSARPGRVLEVIDVPLPRPRHRTDLAVVELRERALTALGGRVMSRWLAPTAVVILLLAVWEGIVRAGWVDPLLLPAPTNVVKSLWTDRSLLAPDLLTTTYEVFIGLALSLLLGAGLAVAMHLSVPVDRALRPLVIGSQAVPIPVLAPLLDLHPRLRPGPEGPDRRAGVLLPGHDQRLRRAARL